MREYVMARGDDSFIGVDYLTWLRARCSGDTLLYLVESKGGAGLYAVSEGYWEPTEKIWLRSRCGGGDDYDPVSIRFRGSAPPDGTHYGMTYREALQAGYVDADQTLQRGYVSRRANPDEAEVYVAGGTRHGELYVLRTNRRSNEYCIRQYLRRAEK